MTLKLSLRNAVEEAVDYYLEICSSRKTIP